VRAEATQRMRMFSRNLEYQYFLAGNAGLSGFGDNMSRSRRRSNRWAYSSAATRTSLWPALALSSVRHLRRSEQFFCIICVNSSRAPRVIDKAVFFTQALEVVGAVVAASTIYNFGKVTYTVTLRTSLPVGDVLHTYMQTWWQKWIQ
jgi:hypothetical protein